MGKSISKKLVIVVVLCLLALIAFKKATNNSMFMHYYYLIFSWPKELERPIVCEDFNFKEKGKEKKFNLKFNYTEIYDVSILDKNKKIPVGYTFKGKIRLDFYHKEKNIHSELIIRELTSYYAEESYDYYKSITLHRFNIPFKGKKDDLSIKITIIEPDIHLSKCCPDLQFCITVSPVI